MLISNEIDLFDAIKAMIDQGEQEGKDVTDIKKRVDLLKPLWVADRNLVIQKLMKEIEDMPVSDTYPFEEPSELEEIRLLRAEGPRDLRQDIKKNELKDKIHGAWLGRCAGCLLGKPVEGVFVGVEGLKRMKGFLKETDQYPLLDYFDFELDDKLMEKWGIPMGVKGLSKGNLQWMPEDDDLNYTVLNLTVLENHGLEFTSNHIGEAWMNYLPISKTYTAERVAYINMALGIPIPYSAMHLNPHNELIGAQIRADIFGYVSPGAPETAAALGWKDARISHVKNGIYGEMFVAAMLAAAFALDDPEEIIRVGLSEIPKTCRLAQAVMDVLQWSTEFTFEDVLGKIYDKYGKYNVGHTINNAGIVVAALVCGGGDFDTTLGMSVVGGMDSDCNGATVGSIIGMIVGASGISSKWTSLHNDLLKTAVLGYSNCKISELSRKTLSIAQSNYSVNSEY